MMYFAARMQFVPNGGDIILVPKNLGMPLPIKLKKVKAKYVIFYSVLSEIILELLSHLYCKLNTWIIVVLHQSVTDKE